MILLLSTLLLLATQSWAQPPALTLVAGRDSLGVGDTLEVWVEVDAHGRMLTSASAIVALEPGIFVPLSESPFTAGDFMPGQVYDNAAVENGGELQLSYVAVSGTGENGGRLAATGRGELGRFRVRAVAPSAGTFIRLVGSGAQRSIYTEEDQPGVEQRFALPEQALELRVGGQAVVVQLPVEIPVPSPVEPVLPTPPVALIAPVNTSPRILPIAPLAVAVGGESYGPLLAGFLSDAEDEFEVLRVEVAGDAQVAARIEGGRLVVRGLRAGVGLVQVLVEDSEGAQASGQVEVEVRIAGQGPLLRALPRMVLNVGGEKVLDLATYVFDPDTPLAALSWTLTPEGGVEVSLAGTQLQLRAIAAGPARVGLQVADPEGNRAMAALALKLVEPPIPAAPADTVAVPADPVPDSTLAIISPDQASTPPDSAVIAPPDTAVQSGNAISVPQAPTLLDSTAATPADTTASGTDAPASEEDQVQSEDSSGVGAVTGEAEISAVDTVQVGDTEVIPAEVGITEPSAVDTARTDSVHVLPETETGPSPAAETPPAPLPFDPIAEVASSSVPPPDHVPATVPPPAADTVQVTQLLEVEPAIEYQVVAGRVDSGLVADRWVKRGAPEQVQWSLRGGKRLLARLDADTRRLYLDAREALPGRQVFFAEAALGAERQQVTIGVGVRAPRLVLLPFPTLELAAGQALALALDSYVEGDFDPADLSWTVEAAEGAGAELDRADRVLHLSGSGHFSLVLRVSSPWGNQVEVLVQIRGADQPATTAPDTTATPALTTVPLESTAVEPQPEPQVPAATPVSAGLPGDNQPPLLRLEQGAFGAEVELWVRADEELRFPPVVRVNGRVLEVEGAGREYRALYTPQVSELLVQVEAEDLAGNAGQTLAALVVQQLQPGAAQVRSPDGRWQAHFPQVQREALVLFREEGEAQCLNFDAERTGPVELVAQYRGQWPPAILWTQGEEWEVLPTYALAGGTQVFARSERAGAFKLGGQAAQVLPAQPLVYPNPFNAQAAIRYQVAGRGAVRVSVRDGQGRIVRQLVDQIQDPGVWTAPWDGRDGAGQEAASGVYFCEVEVTGQRWTGKLLLLR